MAPLIGRYLIIVGFLIIIAGVIIMFFTRIPYIGRLPGDIYIRRDKFTFYFPLATSIIVSVILSLIFYLIGRK